MQDRREFASWLGSQLTAPLRYQLRPPSPFFLAPTESTAASTTGSTTIQSPTTNTTTGSSCSNSSNCNDDSLQHRNPLPFSIRSRFSVAWPHTFPSTEALLLAVVSGRCALRRAEGVRIAHIEGTLFVNGKVSTSGVCIVPLFLVCS